MNPYIFDSRNTGEIYRNDLSSLTGLAVSTTNGTVTTEPLIGTASSFNQDALTIDWTVGGGGTYASVDLGQTYDELYVQFYISVLKNGNQTSYRDAVQIGSAENGGNEVTEIKLNHDTANLVKYRTYVVPNFGSLKGGKRSTVGESIRIGLHINKIL